MVDPTPVTKENRLNNAQYLRREVLIRLAEAFLAGRLPEIAEHFPFDMRPKNSEAPFRCCIYKERAILRQRVIAALGHSIEQDNDETSSAEYAHRTLERAASVQKNVDPVLTVIDIACKGCVDPRCVVTELCQGCLARPCLSCAFGAVSLDKGRATIDPAKCRNCGRCLEQCPYKAITRIHVPCEETCPVGAIHKGHEGRAVIDFDKCTSCGRCMRACPFGAVMERSQIIDVLAALRASRPNNQDLGPEDAVNPEKDREVLPEISTDHPLQFSQAPHSQPTQATQPASLPPSSTPTSSTPSTTPIPSSLPSKRPVVALVAPAIVGQFPQPLEKIAGGLKKIGFSEVFCVAMGADVTSLNEGEEFVRRMKCGDKMMTSSCCPAYIETVRKHVPELLPFVSSTPTPMHYTAQWAKNALPDCVTVFIGPCVAKRREGQWDEAVDYVLTFEEIGAIFVATETELSEVPPEKLQNASAQGRGFAVSGGVASAVAHVVEHLAEHSEDALNVKNSLRSYCVDGLSPQGIKQLKGFATGTPLGNLIEVMTCPGGCVAGAGIIGTPKFSTRQIQKEAANTNSLSGLESSESFQKIRQQSERTAP